MKIVLLGYMASGKSAVGKVVAKKKSIPFLDLDDVIEEKEKLSVSEIFDKKGEIYFRKKETECLIEVLNRKEDLVISLGGGTPCYGSNIDVIKEKSISFYLKASIKTIFERIKSETEQRPLVATLGIEKLHEFIAKHLFERSDFYTKSNHSIVVDDKSILKISEEVLDLL